MKYAITVTETLQRTIITEAEDVDEAIEKVFEARDRCEIVLDADDYDDVSIEPSPYFPGGRVPENSDVSYYWHLD